MNTTRATAPRESYIRTGGLFIHPALARVVEEAICPGTGFSSTYFWSCLERLTAELRPEVEECLAFRDKMQAQVDDFYQAKAKSGVDFTTAKQRMDSQTFLRAIGYLDPDGGSVNITTQFVDPEVATIPAPQLLVPLDNVRYLINAVNARWGSLYDALRGFDVIPDVGMLKGSQASNSHSNLLRDEAVLEFGNRFLDEIVPLCTGCWSEVARLWPKFVGNTQQLEVLLQSGSCTSLRRPSTFVGASGYLGPPDAAAARWMTKSAPRLSDKGKIYLNHHGLHVILDIDLSRPDSQRAPAGIRDIIMESALTTILDLEDCVATADAEDKARVYANLCGMYRGTLEETMHQSGQVSTHSMRKDLWFRNVGGNATSLPGRAVCIVRTAGHHLFSDGVLDEQGKPVPEGFLDSLVTVAAALHDLRGTGRFSNSRAGSIYIVKPKMHGAREVTLTCRLFGLAEELFGLRRNTVKLGIMDEERRTSLNLRECIRVASNRVFFINSGFMDRTGDEIHTCMLGGPVVRKADIKFQRWFTAYLDANVEVGLFAGFPGRGQIGRGSWRKPDSMKAMLEAMIAEPMAGASTAWVPSPAAATLHSIHYHRVDVMSRQMQVAVRQPVPVEDMLEPPFLQVPPAKEVIMQEVRENALSILGYVVRWVDFGIGCTKVPDAGGVAAVGGVVGAGLMVDRATLRICSQLLANWLLHGLITKAELVQVFHETAELVDHENSSMPAYRPMTEDLDNSEAFQVALQLVFDGHRAPSGYVERALCAARIRAKARDAMTVVEPTFAATHARTMAAELPPPNSRL